VSAEFFECQGNPPISGSGPRCSDDLKTCSCTGWDPNRSSLYKANAMGAPSTSWRPGGDPSSAAYANGWERKLPDCDNCDNGDGAAEADCSVGDENPQCNEGEWPDKDHCLVCGDCEAQQLSASALPKAKRTCRQAKFWSTTSTRGTGAFAPTTAASSARHVSEARRCSDDLSSWAALLG